MTNTPQQNDVPQTGQRHPKVVRTDQEWLSQELGATLGSGKPGQGRWRRSPGQKHKCRRYYNTHKKNVFKKNVQHLVDVYLSMKKDTHAYISLHQTTNQIYHFMCCNGSEWVVRCSFSSKRQFMSCDELLPLAGDRVCSRERAKRFSHQTQHLPKRIS